MPGKSYEDIRMNQFINDTHLAALFKELDRLQALLYTTEIVDGEKKLKPLIDNAPAIIGKVQKQINDYKNEHYPDLFPGKD